MYRIYYKLSMDTTSIYNAVIDNPYDKPEWTYDVVILKIEEIEEGEK